MKNFKEILKEFGITSAVRSHIDRYTLPVWGVIQDGKLTKKWLSENDAKNIAYPDSCYPAWGDDKTNDFEANIICLINDDLMVKEAVSLYKKGQLNELSIKDWAKSTYKKYFEFVVV